MIARWFSAAGRAWLGALFALILAGGGCTRMPLTAPTESSIQLSAAPTVPLNGFVDVVATVIEGSGTPVQNGTLVSFTATLGHVEPAEARTENGKVTVKFIAGTQSGMATVTALSGAAKGTSTGSGSETTAPLGATVSIKVGGAAAETVTLRANPATVPRTGGTVTLTALVLDENGGALSGVPVAFSASAGQLQSSSVNTNTNGEASTTLTTPGPATVTATAGAVTSESLSITVAALPTVNLTPPAQSPIEGQPVNIGITIEIPDGANPVRSVRIEFGDGDFEDLGALAGNTSVSHIYQHDGTFTVKVTVTDTAGQQASQALVLTVLPGTPVAVSLTISSNPAPKGSVVTFTADATLALGVTAQYVWNFDDGQPTVTTTGNETTRVFAVAKTYHVKVTVNASDGSVGIAAADLVISP